MYDNVGRTTEQLHAHRTNSPTSDDLYRCAARDARGFSDSLTLAEAGQSITAWTDQLHRVRSAAEFQAVTEAVLGDGHSALGALHQFLEAAAEWCERHAEPEIARGYNAGASHLDGLGTQLAYLGEDHLARTYNPLPASARTAPTRAASAPPPSAADVLSRRPYR
ncbi:hypothetical protein ABZ707_30165 [Streptomyces sp. NPDC006923]|uniref:hypothetical protein n=1 Tax=Streptomyces sp. NPDC006923 TaxID=3155355 RepID=UPI0033E68E14